MKRPPNAACGYSLLGFISYEHGALAETVRYLTKALEPDRSEAERDAVAVGRPDRRDRVLRYGDPRVGDATMMLL